MTAEGRSGTAGGLEAERHHALVLIRYMRTQFGRSLRKGIDRPWLACPGVGQVVRRVRRVAGLNPFYASNQPEG